MPLNIVRQDIVRMEVDAIVNPANTGLLPGGGCCGAIHRAAGPALAKACAEIGGCATGEAVITPGFNLPAKYVIHTPGPVWENGRNGEELLLKNSYKNSLRLAAKTGCESIAFPLISAGIYGYPSALALQHAREAITEWLLDEDENDMQVYLLLFTNSAFLAGNRLFSDILSYIDDNYEGIKHFEAERRQSVFERDNGFPIQHRSSSRKICPTDEMPTAVPDISLSSLEPEYSDFCYEEMEAPLDDMLKDLDVGFSGMLIRLIDEKGLKDADVYKRANVDRKLFNKIKLNPAYHPTKQTALAFAIALKLSLDATKELIGRAGYALTHASKADIVIEYFILHGKYDIMEINETLFELDEMLL